MFWRGYEYLPRVFGEGIHPYRANTWPMVWRGYSSMGRITAQCFGEGVRPLPICWRGSRILALQTEHEESEKAHEVFVRRMQPCQYSININIDYSTPSRKK